jgi:hypothetical protein
MVTRKCGNQTERNKKIVKVKVKVKVKFTLEQASKAQRGVEV